MTPGELIRSRRKAMKLTQGQLGDMLDVSDVAVGHWERGLNLPNGRHLDLLCKILSLTPSQIVSPGAKQAKAETNLQVMTDAFLSAPPELQEAALRVLGVVREIDKRT